MDNVSKYKRNSLSLLIICTIATVGVGSLIAFFGGAFGGYGDFVRPTLTPPDWVFITFLPILFLFNGVSLYFTLKENVYTTTAKHIKTTAIVLWFVQFGVQLTFPFLYFVGNLYALSFVWMSLQLAITLALVIIEFRLNIAAGAFMIPYLLATIGMVWLTLMTTVYNI